MRVVIHGPLGEKYGAEHQFEVRSPREAVAALSANYPGFRQDFVAMGEWGIIADGDNRVGEEGAIYPVSRSIEFVPIIEGRAFLGAALIGALIPSIAGTAAATIIGGLLVAGVVFGVSMLFTPKQKKQLEPAETPDAQRNENYAFSGPVNTTDQGVAVPLLYGRVFCGSVVISAGLDLGVEEIAS